METTKSIYDLKLHEWMQVDEYLIITRVPGGWIYEYRRPSVNILEPVFVPYSNEFNPAKNPKADELPF
jgi:hypothetical protein